MNDHRSREPSRREALTAGAAGLLALTAGRTRGQALAARPDGGEFQIRPDVQPKRKIGLGVQLYSVRDVCAKDFDGALKQIADMGFEGVEFAGYYKYANDPGGLRKKLDELKLKAAGTHIGGNQLAAFKKTVEFHKTIGCRFLIVPGDGRFTDPEKSKEYAEFMNKTAEALKPEGLFCGHHNHTAEFKKADGDKTYWDLFAERTSKDVILQQDMGHSMYAGVDPIAVVRNAPGRIKSTHVKCRPPKGSGKKPFVGEDCFDWKGYLTACYEVGGTEWFLIEQEEYPDGKSSMESTRTSLEGLRRIISELGR